MNILKELMFGAKFKNQKSGTVGGGGSKRIIDWPSRGDAPPSGVKGFDRAENPSVEDDCCQIPGGTKHDKRRKKRRHGKSGTWKSIPSNCSADWAAELRRSHRIFVWGSDPPAPCADFREMTSRCGLPAGLLENLSSFRMPTPVQMQLVPSLFQERDVMACAPTGSGKTLAFLIPILSQLAQRTSSKSLRSSIIKPSAVVLEPTRELATQAFNESVLLADGLGLRIHSLEKMKLGRKREKASAVDVLVCTPNRLSFAVESGTVSLDSLGWLVVDECDKLFEAGVRGFREQLGVIYAACHVGRTRRILLSATFSYEVEEWCKSNLDNVLVVCVGRRNVGVETVSQELVFAGSEHGKLVEMRRRLRTGLEPPVLVFVQSRERAEQLHQELSQDLPRVSVLHSQLPLDLRAKRLAGFRSGEIWVLICTDLLGRGLDFKAVNFVINFDFPTSLISYIHRIGRTGRAGRSGRALTFFTEKDRPLLPIVTGVMKQAGCDLPNFIFDLQKPSRKFKQKLQKKAPNRKNIGKRFFGTKRQTTRDDTRTTKAKKIRTE